MIKEVGVMIKVDIWRIIGDDIRCCIFSNTKLSFGPYDGTCGISEPLVRLVCKSKVFNGFDREVEKMDP